MSNTQIRLTTGTETFSLSQITEDENGPQYGKDSRGVGYTRQNDGVWISDEGELVADIEQCAALMLLERSTDD